MADENKKRFKLKLPNLSTSIAIGLVLGVGCGLFFGEYCAGLKWIGDVYVGLLQMTVLPYVAFSLVANVGRLSYGQGRRVLFTGFGVLMLLWAIGLAMLIAMTFSFPHWESGSFFSTSFIEEPETTNWLGLFVPANPFQSLTENSIPAVVVFCIGLGIALMGMPNKSALLDPLDVIIKALAKLNSLVVQLSPIGMFGIVAYTAGTIDVEQFALIQGYLITYGAACMLLSFFVLPALISAVTSLSMREVLRAARDPLVAAFVIGNTFVVLPMIIDAVQKLMARQTATAHEESHSPEYLIPMAYPFPDVGRVVGLLFIPFAAWFYGTILDSDTFVSMIGVGILGSFAKPIITIPLLLNIAHLPNDIFNLYLASGVVASRFGDLTKCMHLLTFTVLVSYALSGRLRLNRAKLLVGGSLCIAFTFLIVFGIRSYLHSNFKDRYSREKLVTEREMDFPRKAEVLTSYIDIDESTANPHPIAEGESRVQRIQRRGLIRIGYDPDKLPFCYRRDPDAEGKRKLVGFDVELMYYLADDLDVEIEFVRMDPAKLAEHLHGDHFDIAIGALEGTLDQAATLPSIDPYMNITLAIVVQDHDRSRFRTREQVLSYPDLRLGVIKRSFFADRAPAVFDRESLVEFESAADYFGGGYSQVDALVISAEKGSAWTMREPHFTVNNPLKGEVRVPLYYLTASDLGFEAFLQNWLTLKRTDGTYDRLYRYWILGLDDEVKTPRWSMIRDVLHWVE